MQAFEASVKAGARAVMCSYNRLNIFVTPPTPGQGDIYACSNDYTQNQVLKGREPFDYTQLPVARVRLQGQRRLGLRRDASHHRPDLRARHRAVGERQPRQSGDQRDRHLLGGECPSVQRSGHGGGRGDRRLPGRARLQRRPVEGRARQLGLLRAEDVQRRRLPGGDAVRLAARRHLRARSRRRAARRSSRRARSSPTCGRPRSRRRRRSPRRAPTLLKNDGALAPADRLRLHRRRRAGDGPDRIRALHGRRRQRARHSRPGRDRARTTRSSRPPRRGAAIDSTFGYLPSTNVDGWLVPDARRLRVGPRLDDRPRRRARRAWTAPRADLRRRRSPPARPPCTAPRARLRRRPARPDGRLHEHQPGAHAGHRPGAGPARSPPRPPAGRGCSGSATQTWPRARATARSSSTQARLRSRPIRRAPTAWPT